MKTQVQQLTDIINFAIEQEEESVNFYNNLLGVVKSQVVAKEIHNIIKMEQRHRDSLKEIDATVCARSLNQPAQTLRMADYVVEEKPSPGMSLQDLLNIAIHREHKSIELYNDLSKLFAGDEKQLFQNLSSEESQHEHIFEDKWITQLTPQEIQKIKSQISS